MLDRRFDEQMARTRNRPLPTGHVTERQALGYALVFAVVSMVLLWGCVNALTAVLTFCSLIGYAIIYTVWLKHATPQNIVIGGAAGAAPPVLGWTAVTGSVDPNALLLFLIIFTWTPPHFWALAIARRDEYAKAGIPMLPVAYSSDFTRLHILLYTILLVIVTLMPYLTGMSGLIYLAAAHGARRRVPVSRPATQDASGRASADADLRFLDHLPGAVVRRAVDRPLPNHSAAIAAPLIVAPARTPRSSIPWLTAAVIALIAYGSLYPFNFKPDAQSGLVAALSQLSWARAGRGDRISNVLLYLPLGFCLYLWLNERLLVAPP